MCRGTILALLIWLLTLNVALCQNCQHQLRWAPRGYRRKVFLAFFNHAHCHSWTTLNPFTQRSTGRSHLHLPRGSPFAFWCGACFSPSRLTANLTVAMHPGVPPALVPLQAKRGSEHSINSHTNCLLSYGVTAPLKQEGSITCHLNWGSRSFEERLIFDMRNAALADEGEAVVVTTGLDGHAHLTCPDPTLSDKHNIVRVWHYPGEASPRVAMPSLSANISFQPQAQDETVACSVYDMMTPKTVWRRAFRVKASTPEAVRVGWNMGGEDDKNAQSPMGVLTTKNIIIIASAVAGGICGATLLACFSLGVCPCRRKRHIPHEATKQSLLVAPVQPQMRGPQPL